MTWVCYELVYKHGEEEREINAVLKHQRRELEPIQHFEATDLEERIRVSETILTLLGYEIPDKKTQDLNLFEKGQLLAIP